MKRQFLFVTILFSSLVLSSCVNGSIDPTTTDSGPTASETDPTTSEDPNAEYTVSFDLNYPGATNTPLPQTIKKGGKVNRPDDPIREDFTFLGWANGMYSSVMWDFEVDVVTKDITLYASWHYSYVEPEPIKKTFYVHAPTYWLADGHSVSLYAWSIETGETNSSWPGDLMKHVEGQNFSYDVSEEYTHIIFARVTQGGAELGENQKAQTFDLDITSLTNPDFNYYWINEDVRYDDNKSQGRWGIYPHEPDPLPPEETDTYYVQIPEFWTVGGHTVSIYLWGSGGPKHGWPGEVMSHVKDFIYSFEIPKQYINIVFARVTPQGNEATQKAQTVDLIKPTDGKNLYIIDPNEIYMPSKSVGEWVVHEG